MLLNQSQESRLGRVPYIHITIYIIYINSNEVYIAYITTSTGGSPLKKSDRDWGVS